jgi:uncharacterized protein
MPTKLKRFSVRNTDRDTVLATNAKLAASFASRFLGLMGRKGVEEGGGLLIKSSSSIHSFWMRFRFDAIYMDNDGRVVKVVREMKPWRMSFGGRGAKHVLELPGGVAERTGTEPGDTLAFADPVEPASEPATAAEE